MDVTEVYYPRREDLTQSDNFVMLLDLDTKIDKSVSLFNLFFGTVSLL